MIFCGHFIDLMLKIYLILNLYFLMLFIEIRENQCAYVLEVRLRQYRFSWIFPLKIRHRLEIRYRIFSLWARDKVPYL